MKSPRIPPAALLALWHMYIACMHYSSYFIIEQGTQAFTLRWGLASLEQETTSTTDSLVCGIVDLLLCLLCHC